MHKRGQWVILDESHVGIVTAIGTAGVSIDLVDPKTGETQMRVDEKLGRLVTHGGAVPPDRLRAARTDEIPAARRPK
jgi:hypothetical protein